MVRVTGGEGERFVLAVNCGSSSLKFGLYRERAASLELYCEGNAEEIGSDHGRFWFQAPGEQRGAGQARQFSEHAAALDWALEELQSCGAGSPSAVGHRIVHGGPKIRQHCRVSADVLKQLRGAVAFAPLHLPAALCVLESVERRLPSAVQVACFDTAFHSTMPDLSRTYALPGNVRDLGVERYGFHGLSLESIMAQLHPIPKRSVVAHLGNGASVTAIREGKSIDTSMGLTPSGGVMMGTRCGDLDPGVVLFMLQNGFERADDLEDVFDRCSGLLGVSGLSSDVRELLSARKASAEAGLALQMFCYQVRKMIGAMGAALGGIDLLAFTGGIGEHAAELREEICSGLEFLSGAEVRVLPSQEDLQMARITSQIAATAVA